MITTLTSKIDKLTATDNGVASKELNSYAGLSTDTKPTTGIVTGSIFIEVDTGDIYLYNEAETSCVKKYSLQS